MPHFFIKSESVIEKEIKISDKETYNHIVKSLRAKVGEKLLLIDENEIEYTTEIKDINKVEILTDIIESHKSTRDLKYNLFLAQSPLRSDAQNTIIEKATELGVRGIYPIYTDNCAVKKSVIVQKIEKWQKIMYEASKQCERANIPTTYDLTTIDEIYKNGEFDKVIALCERYAESSMREYFAQNKIKENENVLIIIGPEGGFSDKEFKFFKTNKIPMLTLGDLILKAETAVIVTLGNIIYDSI